MSFSFKLLSSRSSGPLGSQEYVCVSCLCPYVYRVFHSNGAAKNGTTLQKHCKTLKEEGFRCSRTTVWRLMKAKFRPLRRVRGPVLLGPQKAVPQSGNSEHQSKWNHRGCNLKGVVVLMRSNGANCLSKLEPPIVFAYDPKPKFDECLAENMV